ncbi:protein kinase [Streptomyces sp. NPDC016845]|uniref:serine/threonine-protein kinase n=1 Tax=Streptomyces sp. NPDC016845 TaxID=3364972 RepID=UPI0037AC6DA4
MPIGPGGGSAATPGRDPLLVGGRYRMRDQLGSGGTADVFAAVDTVLGREVAVKVFRPVAGMVTADRICGEALTLARLRHPALVTVYDAGRHGDSAYMVTELVCGTTLRNRLSVGSLTATQTIRLGTVLTSALDHVHGCDIIHRDIKPSNILLDELGAPRLADFGLSRAIDERTRTEPGTLIGSLAYMAPEQLLGGGASKASDVYALGLVLLEALTGDTSRRATPLEAGIGHLLHAPRIPDQVPDGLARLLSLITAQEPQERPDTARILGLLEEAAATSAPAPATASHPMIRTAEAFTTTATHRASSARATTPTAASADTAAAPAPSPEASVATTGSQTRRSWLRPVTVAAAGVLTLAITGTVLTDVAPPPAAGAGNHPHSSPSTPAKTTAPQPAPTDTTSKATQPPVPATARHSGPERGRSVAGTPGGSTGDNAVPSTPTPPTGRPAQEAKKQKSKSPKKNPEKTKGTKKKK